MFTLGEVECAGACVNAPLFSVNDDYYVCGSRTILLRYGLFLLQSLHLRGVAGLGCDPNTELQPTHSVYALRGRMLVLRFRRIRKSSALTVQP